MFAPLQEPPSSPHRNMKDDPNSSPIPMKTETSITDSPISYSNHHSEELTLLTHPNRRYDVDLPRTIMISDTVSFENDLSSSSSSSSEPCSPGSDEGNDQISSLRQTMHLRTSQTGTEWSPSRFISWANMDALRHNGTASSPDMYVGGTDLVRSGNVNVCC